MVNEFSREPSPITLDPSYRLGLSILLLSLPLILLSVWATVAVAAFGLFLTIQTATLRLVFTAETLEIYRGEHQIRNFPYVDWLHWEIFIKPIPVLFYFREVHSIHFLPILFNPTQLRTCLERYVGLPPLPVGSKSVPGEMSSHTSDPTMPTTEADLNSSPGSR